MLIILFIVIAGLRGADGRSQTADTTKTTVDHREVLWPEYSAFQTPPGQDSIIPKSLYFRMKSTAYFKNNEFKNPFLTGSSLIGIYFEPLLEYHPDTKTTIRAGANLLKYHGEDRFERAVPVLSLQYDATDHFSLIFGTIYGTVNHNLIEPVQDFENYLIDNYENGLELLWNYPQFRSDVWLNWEQFLKPGDPFQERFTAGSNSTFMLFDSKLFQITAPFSTLFRHMGGETDATNLPASTRLNLVQGLRLNWLISNSFVKSVALAQNYVEFLEINPGDQVTVPYGHGSYSRCFLDTKIGSFEVGYWKAHNFISPHGMLIFQSVSQKDPLFLQSDRQMLVLKYQLDLNLTHFLKFALRFEPYYHYDTGRIDHSWSVYLVFDDEFLIAKTKRK
ncbi:MAG: hypothetical protein D4R64_09485 [Porphyromonadaceae bacterium]|nr:MAG: hypothetical protein D4R64_09485 [Porphyromonadaceae bacterium]